MPKRSSGDIDCVYFLLNDIITLYYLYLYLFLLCSGVQALEKHEQAIRDTHEANAKATADTASDSKNVPGDRVIEITPNKPPIVSADIGTDTGAMKGHKDVDKEGK